MPIFARERFFDKRDATSSFCRAQTSLPGFRWPLAVRLVSQLWRFPTNGASHGGWCEARVESSKETILNNVRLCFNFATLSPLFVFLGEAILLAAARPRLWSLPHAPGSSSWIPPFSGPNEESLLELCSAVGNLRRGIPSCPLLKPTGGRKG